ncbi:MAG: sugar transferase [Gemmatimonadetes bacterium]|nr:sugar transferase [Gemmatimonadota bacterium]
MSADQERLRVRDRAAVAEERVDQVPPSRNGQRPNAKLSIGELGERVLRGQGVSNGVAPRHAAATNGVGPEHASTNGARLGRTLVAHDVDWDSCLPDRSSGLAWRAGQRVKRVLDAVLAFGMVLALLPLFIVVALMVRLTSRGPSLYVCEYVGRRGRRFIGYKFRTMVADAEAKKAALLHLNHMKGPAFKIRRDPRITPLGRILRKFSIDELPQLWNVVKGDMSLVGPRPPLPEEWLEFKDWQRAKLAVVPGITCFWQVNGRSDIVDFDEWARLDLEYIERWSLWEDSKLLVRTIPAVLKGYGAY